MTWADGWLKKKRQSMIATVATIDTDEAVCGDLWLMKFNGGCFMFRCTRPVDHVARFGDHEHQWTGTLDLNRDVEEVVVEWRRRRVRGDS